MSSTLLVSIEGGIARIALHRPNVFNSFNREMSLALIEQLDKCAKDDNVRVIYLTGEGKAFSAGQDLNEAIEDNGIGFDKILYEHYNPIIKRLRSIEKPIVAAVNGVAAGAGANIALACDITFAAESANFIQAFSKIALVPDSGGTYFLPRLIGMQRTAALMMLGDKLPAKQAADWGLIYQAVADADLHTAAMAMAQRLALMPRQALGLTKRLLNQSLNNDLESQLVAEGELQILSGQSEDYQEGVNAFLEKRKAVFK